MRNRTAIFTLGVLLPLQGYAQHLAPDSRPFGKYLLRICTWNLKDLQVSCLEPGYPVAAAKTPQTIEFKQVSAPSAPAGQDPVYPLAVNQSFWVSAKATSGLPVDISVLAGSVVREPTPTGAPAEVSQFRVIAPGTVVLQANRNEDAYYEQASPVTLVLDVGASSASSCGGLFPLSTSPRTIATVDAPTIVGLLGTPVPYVLVAPGPHTILIYTTREVFQPEGSRDAKGPPAAVNSIETRTGVETPTASEINVLTNFQTQIQALLNRNADVLGLPASPPFTVELEIPHSTALGDLATRISGLNYSAMAVADVGNHKVRITATSQPDCKTWTAFLTDIRELAWNLHPEPWNARLYYLGQNTGANGASSTGAADLSTAFTGLSSSAPATSTATSTSTTTATPAASPSTATLSVSQPAGSVVQIKSDTTPCVIAGLTMSNSSACAGSSGSGAATPSPAPAVTPAPPAAASMSPLESDLLLFSTPNPGDDEAIAERKRIIAQLDLPRPEMVINGWVLQNSTTNKEAIGAFSSLVSELVGNYNDSLENMVLRGWAHIRDRIARGDFFDGPFYHYLSDRYVGDTSAPISGKDPQSAAQQFLNTTSAKLTFPDGSKSTDYGICEAGKYCLGYAGIFDPLKPRLTDLVIALFAAKDTPAEIRQAINSVEGPSNPAAAGFCDAAAVTPDEKDRCRGIWKELDLDRVDTTCESRDLHFILGSSFPRAQASVPAVLFLNCFRNAADRFLGGNPAAESITGPSLVRSYLANFLFHYKMSQQYPHEFQAYDLTQSADALNSALNPLIDALNRDLATFQRYVRADVQYQVERLNRAFDSRCCLKKLFSTDKPSFFNDGIVTVRTISGQWTYSLAQSQNFLNVSSAPQLTDVLNSLTGAPSNSGSAPISALFPTPGSLASAKLAAAFLNNYQTTYAQIGRSLAISAIPRSLATASSAEIVVSLNADDSSNPPVYVSGPQNGQAANLSRVANHDTSTRVRIESLKLFEVSSFSAILERSRSRIPLIPPLIEIPYIGTIAGIPVPPAKEYHQSTALMSAMVVPTAADIAYGLQFQFDQTAEGGKETCSLLKGATSDDRCRLRRLVSMADFGERNSVNLYNRAIVHCFATEMRSPYSSIVGSTPASANTCSSLTFDTLPYSSSK